MQTYPLSQLTEEMLNALVTLYERPDVSDKWDEMTCVLDPEEIKLLNYLKSLLQERQLVLMNEATLWARAIYPLLVLAEQEHIQAWAGVPLRASYPTFELEGEADGALAMSVAGKMRHPYLVVHETKRGINAPNPQYQLYGEMLAAAWLNWKGGTSPEQEIFGCYTVADSWTFVYGIVRDIETEKPKFTVELSKTYNGFWEAERIVQILKTIVAKHIDIGT